MRIFMEMEWNANISAIGRYVNLYIAAISGH